MNVREVLVNMLWVRSSGAPHKVAILTVRKGAFDALN